MQLLDEAGLMGWYKELPNGLETLVGEKGIKLSAGQKQRLNLIRGILIDKELYFFYDGFWFFAMISLIYAIGYEVIRYNSSTYVMFLLFISIMDIVVIPQITKIFKKKLIQ